MTDRQTDVTEFTGNTESNQYDDWAQNIVIRLRYDDTAKLVLTKHDNRTNLGWWYDDTAKLVLTKHYHRTNLRWWYEGVKLINHENMTGIKHTGHSNINPPDNTETGLNSLSMATVSKLIFAFQVC